MKNLKKLAKMASLAFLNGIRLHKDSITLFNVHSYPSAFQLSILAQEEIGKSFLLEEEIWQTNMGGLDNEIEYFELLNECLLNHRVKQGWFSQFADQDKIYARYGKLTRFIKQINNGKLDERKQIATYLGLPKIKKNINWKGKIIIPEKRLREKETRLHITRVNDFIIFFIEGCRRGVLTTDTEELDGILTINLARELELLWPFKSNYYKRIIEKYRKNPIIKEDW